MLEYFESIYHVPSPTLGRDPNSSTMLNFIARGTQNVNYIQLNKDIIAEERYCEMQQCVNPNS